MTLVEPLLARRIGAAAQLRGELRVPSDKSIAHRALLLNAMGEGAAVVIVSRPGRDVRSTAAVIAALGALTATTTGANGIVRFHVQGAGSEAQAVLGGPGGESLDCGNSGTTVRLAAGALAGRPATAATELTGDASLSRRPMERVAAPLRAMGGAIATNQGRLPLSVRGRRPLRALAHRLEVSSAQVLGAITMAALAADGRTTIETPGPTRDHTERLLAWLGAPVRRHATITTIDGPAGYRTRSLEVPGDLSSAAAWLVGATLHPDALLRLATVGLNPSRLAVVQVLRQMGAEVVLEPAPEGQGPEPTGNVTVRSAAALQAVHLAGGHVAALIDELPLLAVAMAGAGGVSELHDAAELRVKESDRIALVVGNLRACGVSAEELPDGWRIQGSPARRTAGRPASAEPVVIETGGDHRIAIAFAIGAAAGLLPEVAIDDPACIDVSYPGFWDDLGAAGWSAA